jgi:DNA-binding CsgD family transcriptional regulator
MIPTIDNIISGAVFQNDMVLASLLRKADQCRDGIFYSVWIMDRKIDYISPLCRELTGYAPADFIAGGADFIFKIVHEQAIPDVISKQIECITRYKAPNYNPYAIEIDQFRTPIKTRDGQTNLLISQVIVLLFKTNADVEYSLGMMCKPNDKSMSICNQILQAIKKRHNEIYNHPPIIHQPAPLNLIHVTSKRIDKEITPREAEVLAYLAKGFSTIEISNALGISSHTIETHRRSLLLKFEAKNSVELIKKASKVFWLE